MKMKCIIPGSNIKVFGRAIHSLSKIGEELYIEPLEHGFALRTVNSSRSAYACFVFAPSFFLHYNDGAACEGEDSEEEALKCKIGVKSVLTVFKSLSTLEKTVEKCRIKHDAEDCRLVFQLHCKHGIVKTYNLAYIECETLQAVFSKDLSPNVLCAQTKLLCDVVLNFQTNQEEVTLIVDPEKAKFKNYTEDEPDQSKVIHTELSLVPEEFESYQVGVDNEVTFCLKELRAILAFSEPSNLPLSIHFESPGRPIVFAIDSDPSFEANFVLATLADNQSSSQVSSSQRSTQERRLQKPVPPKRIGQQVQRTANSKNSVTRENREESAVFEQVITNGSSRHNAGKEKRLSAAAEQLRAAADELEKEAVEVTHVRTEETTLHHGEGDGQISPVRRNETTSLTTQVHMGDGDGDNEEDDDEETPCSPVIPLMNPSKQNVTSGQNKSSKRQSLLGADSSSEDDDAVPGTPPAKRFKSVFMGLSQSTTASTQPSQRSKAAKAAILAEDTDEEDDG